MTEINYPERAENWNLQLFIGTIRTIKMEGTIHVAADMYDVVFPEEVDSLLKKQNHLIDTVTRRYTEWVNRN